MTSTKGFEDLRTRDDVRTLYIHDQAGETMRRMFAQVEKIKETFGPHAEYERAVTTLHQCLANLLRIGFSREAYVTKELDYDKNGLTLYIQEGDVFVFGIVWFRERMYDDTDRAGIAGSWSCHS